MKAMMFPALLLGLMTLAFHPPVEKKSYNVDTKKSTIVWKGRKVTGSHDGNVTLKSGSLEFDGSKLTGGAFEMDMNTITCNDLSGNMKDNLVGHLKSDDFFGVEKYPVAQFKITKASRKGKTDQYDITGDLTIKGQTHPVSFVATVKDGASTATADATIKVDRTKYGVRYGSGKFFDNLGDKAISDEFDLDVKLEISKK